MQRKKKIAVMKNHLKNLNILLRFNSFPETAGRVLRVMNVVEEIERSDEC